MTTYTYHHFQTLSGHDAYGDLFTTTEWFTTNDGKTPLTRNTGNDRYYNSPHDGRVVTNLPSWKEVDLW